METKVKKPFWKRLVKGICFVLLAVVLLVAALFGYLTATEYRPDDVEAVTPDGSAAVFSGDTLKLVTFNTGYAGLGRKSDFFMDGGKGVRPESEEYVRENIAGIEQILTDADADFYFLQETDTDSTRSYGIDETAEYHAALSGVSLFALNYRCAYVPYPIPTIGKVTSGVQTVSRYAVTDAQRISLPCPFSWPVSIANLKRCLLVTRVPIADSERELVLVNLHLEAYDDGEGKAKQTEMLFSILTEEYEKGNYVIAGGDFNQTFPGGLSQYPIKDASLWTPGTLEQSSLPDGWQFAFDLSAPTCRLLNEPYDPDDEATQYYVIDGYILSPNVELLSVQTLREDFRYSDHNPVALDVRLLPEE